MRSSRSVIIAFFLLLAGGITAQETGDWKKNWSVTGYHKLLYQHNSINANFVPQGGPITFALPQLNTNDYLYHNRLNIRYYGQKFTFAAGVRNRIFAGYTNSEFDQLRADNIPPYAGFDSFLAYQHQPGYLPLYIPWVQTKAASALTVFDRFYVDMDREKWHLRVGRQRINWGINQQFNPNDLFNPFNLFDIDYEERPGVDAVRYERYTGMLSSWEVAFAPADSLKRTVMAYRYRTNYKGYDFQAIVGKWKTRLALGGGWSGNLKKAGFSGEFTYFLPYKDLPQINPSQTNFVLSTSVDHAFLKGPFVSLGYLYNYRGTGDPSLLNLVGGSFTTSSPYGPLPFKHTVTSTVLGSFSDLFGGSITFLSTPRAEVFILIPALNYSIKQDLELSVFAQFFMTDNPFEDQYSWFSNALFLRLKQSF